MSVFTEVINNLNTINEQTDIMLYFTQKERTGYTTYAPNVSAVLRNDLVNLMKDSLCGKRDLEICDFNPTQYNDGTVEQCTIDYVGNFDEVIESFTTPDHVDTELDPNNLTFYCISVIDRDRSFKYKFFRRVTKFRKISANGFMAYFSGNMLKKMTQPMLGLDGLIDLMCIDDSIYIFNHISLERIFRLNEKYETTAMQTLEILKNTGRIDNFDQLEEDCLNDLRYHKILSKILSRVDNMDSAFDNFDNIRQVIDDFDLDIQIVEGERPKIKYEDKHQRMDILHIITDAYYRSIIRQRNGIDEK